MEANVTLGAVLTCQVVECSYNIGEHCMAPDIVVGDQHATCDTFTTRPVSPAEEHPLVATCHVRECTFNIDEGCRANGITVGSHERHADCVTYRV